LVASLGIVLVWAAAAPAQSVAQVTPPASPRVVQPGAVLGQPYATTAPFGWYNPYGPYTPYGFGVYNPYVGYPGYRGYRISAQGYRQPATARQPVAQPHRPARGFTTRRGF
jgi:hypothetical protein